LRKGKETGEVKVVNDVTMSPTSTADAAKAILALVVKRAPRGIYHVVNSGSATWFEFAQQIIDEAGIHAKVVPISSKEYPTTAIRPSYSALDNRKASQIVGEIPHWKQSLRQYVVDKGHVRTIASCSLSRT